ncbi:hypothetical protein MFLAVUS_010073 [Mucor flavus]|uniref:Uncharacterized protein n=1 Tax=Mucor flavus TaxID=439312 RepID=A0ABP9ZBQ1_9FUNG
MDCQEWKDKDLSQGYKQFEQDLDKYPTAVATRCFAFDPTETQEDNTKGLIMIPNVGNMSFYMSTMIFDFASEILNQFAILANRIENLSVLESPLPTTIHLPPRSKPPPLQQRFSTPPLSISPTNSTNSLKRSSLQPSTLTAGETVRTKKRTPGRIKKLLGDFYLLAGRLPDAVNYYDQAIEMTKITSDFLWLASAMEGWISATLLLEYLQEDIGHIVSRNPIIPDINAVDGEEEQISADTTTTIIQGPRSTLTVIVETYSKIVTNYSRVALTANFPVPDLVYAESCLKVSRVLTTAYLNNGWNESTMTLLVHGKLRQDENEKTFKSDSTPFLSITELASYKKSGLPRHDIAEWVTKIWEIHISELALLDQINITASMSLIYSSIGYYRKAAWLMNESVERMLPLLIQHRRTGLSKAGNRLISENHDSGVLEIIKRICEVYGIGERNVHDGGALEAMQREDQGIFTNIANKRNPQGAKSTFGWPELQIDVLKQCITVSDALIDNGSRLYYTTVLLKNLYRYIPKAEQIRLATTIQGLVASSNTNKRAYSPSEKINYWGVNIVSSIEAKKPISRKAVYLHPIKNEAIENAKKDNPEDADPFIYNPFAKKADLTYKIVLVKDEVSEFNVTLINPFGFDLELQNIILSTSGVAFDAVPTALTIPANATVFVPLMGTPEETGTLIIRGCLIQIVGFSEQEFLIEPQVKKSPEDTSNDNFVKIKHCGLDAIKSSRKKEITGDSNVSKFYELEAIDDQPLLKIKRTSMMHGAVMLYEGEVTHITMELENIGNIAVDFITLSFTDSTTSSPLAMNPELPPEEQYEIELHTKGTRVFSWEGTDEKESTDSIEIGIHGGTIQIDYGYLNRTVPEVQDVDSSDHNDEITTTFYTRQLYLNVMITVYKNLEPSNWDVVYLRHSIPAPKEVLELALLSIKNQNIPIEDKSVSIIQSQPVEDLLLVTRNLTLEDQEKNEYCLVTLDIRNTWTTPFDVDFTILNKAEGDYNDDNFISCITIQPGSTSRIILPLKRLFLSPTIFSQEIPSFDPNKQFVVSQGPKISEEQQKARLQMFWYREELLHCITASWYCRATKRSGELNLRSSLRLNSLQLGVLKKEDIEFLIDLKGENVQKLSHRRFSCVCNEYVTMNITIRNRFRGVQQVVLPEVSPSTGVISHSFPIYFLSRGQFEILYHAEDVHTRKIYCDHEWAIIDVAEN